MFSFFRRSIEVKMSTFKRLFNEAETKIIDDFELGRAKSYKILKFKYKKDSGWGWKAKDVEKFEIITVKGYDVINPKPKTDLFVVKTNSRYNPYDIYEKSVGYPIYTQQNSLPAIIVDNFNQQYDEGKVKKTINEFIKEYSKLGIKFPLN